MIMKRIFAIFLLFLLLSAAVIPAAAAPSDNNPALSEPSESVSDESSPDESTPDESSPDESKPNESVPKESTPEESTPPATEPAREYLLTVMFRYENGDEVSQTKKYYFKAGDSYNITPPQKNGYTPDPETVTGIMENRSITVTVTYKKNPEPQPEPGVWTISGRNVRYMERGKPITGNATIDDVEYQFDGNGNLIYTGFFTVGGKELYLDGGTITVGYKIINGAWYCFDGNGYKITGAYDGHTFDISGNIIDEGLTVVEGRTYLIINNALYQGYYISGEDIVYFGDDYAMVTDSVNADGCVFDSNGAVISGINASDLTSYNLKSVPFDGEPCTPEFSVKFKGIVLIKDVHYTVEYSNNDKPGQATATVTGMGPVEGTVKFFFNISKENTKKLTIKYRNEAGMSVADKFEDWFGPDEDYSVVSPKIDGYVPDKEVVEGTMGNENLELVVIYSKVAASDAEESSAPVADDDPPSDSSTPNDGTSTDNSSKEQGYDWKKFIVVFAVSTVITGGAIALIINWDFIWKKAFAPRRKKKV